MVPAGVVRVNRAVVVVAGGAGQRVPVETFLGCHVAGLEVGGVADGELNVSLGSRFVRGGVGRSGARPGLILFLQGSPPTETCDAKNTS